MNRSQIVDSVMKEVTNNCRLEDVSPEAKAEMERVFDENDSITLTESIAEVPITIKVRPIDIIAEYSSGQGFGKTPDSQYDPIAEAVRNTIANLGYDPGPLSRAESGLQGIGKRTYEVSDTDIAKIIERLRPEYLTEEAKSTISEIGCQTPMVESPSE